jgi:hypothetical protein
MKAATQNPYLNFPPAKLIDDGVTFCGSLKGGMENVHSVSIFLHPTCDFIGDDAAFDEDDTGGDCHGVTKCFVSEIDFSARIAKRTRVRREPGTSGSHPCNPCRFA